MTRPPKTSSLNAAIAERFFGLKHPVTAYAWNDRKKREKPYHVYRERAGRKGYPTGGWSHIIYEGYVTLITETGEKLTHYSMPRQYDENDAHALKALEKVLSLLPRLSVEIRSHTTFPTESNTPRLQWTVQFCNLGVKQQIVVRDALAEAIVTALDALPPEIRVDHP